MSLLNIVESVHEAQSAAAKEKVATTLALNKLMAWRMDQLKPFVDEFNQTRFWPKYSDKIKFNTNQFKWTWGEDGPNVTGITRYHEALAPLTMEMVYIPKSGFESSWTVSLIEQVKRNDDSLGRHVTTFMPVNKDHYTAYDSLHRSRNSSQHIYPDEAFVAAMKLFAPFLEK